MTAAPLPDLERIDYGNRLRNQTIACRLYTARLGTRRTLSKEQIGEAAGLFHADAKSLGASKKLVDTRHPAYRQVTGVLSRSKSYWKSLTVPYPDPGVRLLLRDRVEEFDNQMKRYQESLDEHLVALQASYTEIQLQAREQLGDLFDTADYPANLDDQFELGWDYPSIDPPAHLKQLHPELYAAEMAKVHARFEEAVALTEQAFIGRFQELVSRLAGKLRGGEDGKPKVFHASTVDNLRGFFEQFQSLNIGSSSELSQLVEQCKDLVGDTQAGELRSDESLRNRFGQVLGGVEEALNTMLVDRPSRAIDLGDDEGGENSDG